MKKIFEAIKTMSYEKGAQYLKEKGFVKEDASKEKDFADLYFFADHTSENWFSFTCEIEETEEETIYKTETGYWSVSENGEVENGEKI